MAILSYFRGTDEQQGTIYSILGRMLADWPFYRQFRQGGLSRDELARGIDGAADELARQGAQAEWSDYMKRIAVDETAAARRALGILSERGALPAGSRFDPDAFREYRRRMYAEYDHGRLTTYIFPEEECLAYAAAQALRPKSAFVAGGYYGYWAAWLLPGVRAAGGQCVLADIDEEVTELANRNIASLGFADCAEARCADAVVLLGESRGPVDLLVIDASGSYEDPRSDYRGKAIYAPILRAALPRMGKGAAILAHNAGRADEPLEEFFKLVDSVCTAQAEPGTVCDAGVYVIG
jgi:predicted O-methyltransferase YrrM